MMPTIRVDQKVFEGLQELAEAFVDTPNTVIQRLLVEKGVLDPSEQKESVAKRASRAKRVELTPQHVYEEWLLRILWFKFGGNARKADATRETIKAMEAESILKEADYKKVSSGETRAENTVAWGRNTLKERGLIKLTSSRGIWELTDKGIERAKQLPKR